MIQRTIRITVRLIFVMVENKEDTGASKTTATQTTRGIASGAIPNSNELPGVYVLPSSDCCQRARTHASSKS
jgi:hypothetical protein